MLKKSHIAAAVAAASLATGALASTAFADPVTIDTGSEYQLGDYGSCSPGAAPSAPAELLWHENANGTSIRPEINGDLCLQDTSAEARVAVVLHTGGFPVQTVTKFSSPSLIGSGGPLTTSFVDEIAGARVSKSLVHHVHVKIEEPDGAGGWDTVSGTDRVLYVP
jgi:hypothetical protein